MFRSLDLLWQLFRYNPGKPDNADLIAKVVIHFTGNSLDNQIELWSKTETGQRYLRGERIIDNIESFRGRDENTLGELFTFFILETILLGRALKINPFDQPAVELIKTETKKILT